MKLKGVLKKLKRSIQKKLFGRGGIVKHSIPVVIDFSNDSDLTVLSYVVPKNYDLRKINRLKRMIRNFDSIDSEIEQYRNNLKKIDNIYDLHFAEGEGTMIVIPKEQSDE